MCISRVTGYRGSTYRQHGNAGWDVCVDSTNWCDWALLGAVVKYAVDHLAGVLPGRVRLP
jgi:hypothetical protein